ncbi:hypothetical protein ACIOYT_00485 [Streptomyces halstedii]|uniref:hypothetical protein n=1 Tax=Streptomyces halstedii TaxID=1944 RepID=UPI00382E1081
MSIIPSASTNDTTDFWAKLRESAAADRGQQTDPTACGTCRGLVEGGGQVEHDECAQRATLLQAPDHPDYELLAGVSLEENAKLPARFHIPVFDDCGIPNAWLCAVCQEDGVVSLWPCKTAVEQGARVFTPQHEAETARKRQGARLASLEEENARLRADLVVQESRVARHYIGRIRFLEAELVRRPDRAGVMALLAHDVETAIVGLPLAERRGAEVVLQVIRVFAEAPTVPTGDETRPVFVMPEATA